MKESSQNLPPLPAYSFHAARVSLPFGFRVLASPELMQINALLYLRILVTTRRDCSHGYYSVPLVGRTRKSEKVEYNA
jgi:hypothetical protein